MKKLLVLFVLFIGITACEPTPQNSVDTLTVTESDFILNVPRDTMVVAWDLDSTLIYEIENEVVVTEFGLRNNYSVPPNAVWIDFIGLMALAFVIGLIVGVSMKD